MARAGRGIIAGGTDSDGTAGGHRASPLVALLMVVSAVVLLIDVLILLLGPVVAPYDPNSLSIREVSQGPSAAHRLGTDRLGRDILSRKLYGAHISADNPLVKPARETTARRIIAILEVVALAAMVVGLLARRQRARYGLILGILAGLILLAALAHIVSVAAWDPSKL